MLFTSPITCFFLFSSMICLI
uniref:Uncharacterized protein n=1 Tax=Arundo donax TaxID=35708 RepID=A0A0A9EMF9_ARUDO